MSERISERKTLRLSIPEDRRPALQHTPTQKDIAAIMEEGHRTSIRRDRGCAYRPLLEGSLVARFCEAATFHSLLALCKEVPRLDIVDLCFDDGSGWARFFAFLRTHNVSTALNLITVSDTTPDVRGATLRLRMASSAAGLPFDVTFTVTPAQDWPGTFQRTGDALAVVANMALHHVPDDGPDIDSYRTMVLRRLRRLEPNQVIVCEADFGPEPYQGVNRLGTHGSSANKVMEALVEMHEVGGGPHPFSSTSLIALSLESAHAEPGIARPELPDRFENWRRRFFDSGYTPIDLLPLRGPIVRDSGILPQAVVAPDQQALRLSWRGKPIANASVWTPRSRGPE